MSQWKKKKKQQQQLEQSTDNTMRPNMAASVLSLAASSDGTNKAVIEKKAADSIGKRTSWTRSTVSYAAQAVASNLSDSFTTLLNSRLRAWTLLLLRHSLTTQTNNEAARSRLLNMLSAKLKVLTAETTYRTLPLPESATGVKPKDADVILPLLFEVVLLMSIQEKDETVTLRAPGTIAGEFVLCDDWK